MRMKTIYTALLFLLISVTGFSGTVTVTINYTGFLACGGCDVCGGDYWCFNTASSYCGNTLACGTKTFADPVPAGNVVTNIQVEYYSANCAGGSMQVTIDGNTVPVVYDGNTGCLCSSNPCGITATSSATFPCGMPGYIYGGTNSMQLCTGLSVCINKIVLVITYTNPATINPTITASGPTTFCAGSNVTLNAGAGYTSYAWSNGANTQSITVNTSGTYTVTVTSTTGCTTGTASQVVTVNPAPTITANASPATICPGGSTTLTASGGTTYTWQPGALSGSSVVVSPGASTTYTVTGTNSSGCSATVLVPVTVNSGVAVVVTPSTATICPGGNVSLTASGASTYTWSTGSTNPTVSVSPASTTTYTVTGVSGSCSGSGTAVVTVNPPPTVTVTSTTSICAGGNATLTAGGAATYAWNTGSTAASIIVSPASTTTYTVTGSNVGSGCSATAESVVTVNPPPTITVNPPNPTVCPGSTVVLTASGGSSYSWSDGETTASISVTPASSVTYTVTGTNAAGCSNTAVVTINIGSSVTVSVTPVADTICPGASAVLTASGATNYTWSTGSTNAVVSVSPGISTTYTVTGTAGSCTGTGTVAVTVNPMPVVTVTPSSTSVCQGGNATLTVSGANTFVWSTGSTSTSITVTPATTTTYTVTGSSSGVGCQSTASGVVTVNPPPTITINPASPAICPGSNVTLTASGGATYTWSDGETTAAINVTPAGPTTYTVTGTDVNGCTNTGTVAISINPSPTVTATATSTSICSGNNVNLSATGGVNYTWLGPNIVGSSTNATATADPSSNATYTVVGTNASGCPDTATVAITVTPSPTVTISLSSAGDTLCNGQSVTLTATGAGNFTWSTGATTSSITVTPAISPTVIKVVINNGACSDSATQSLYLFPALSATSITHGDSICAGASTTVGMVVTGGSQPYTYAWSNGLGTSAGPFVVNPSATTTYTCMVTDACGNTTTGTDIIGVWPSPKAIYSPTPNPVPGGEFVAFVDNSTLASSWYWTFGDGDTSNISFPYHQYDTAGTYIVWLYVRSNNGCRDSLEDTIHVIENIYVPNVFTPNGDGINDVFHVTATSIKTYNITIFDRWGQEVFTSTSPNDDWTGKSEGGVTQADGTYYYIILATDYANKNFKYDGYVQLIGGGGK